MPDTASITLPNRLNFVLSGISCPSASKLYISKVSASASSLPDGFVYDKRSCIVVLYGIFSDVSFIYFDTLSSRFISPFSTSCITPSVVNVLVSWHICRFDEVSLTSPNATLYISFCEVTIESETPGILAAESCCITYSSTSPSW